MTNREYHAKRAVLPVIEQVIKVSTPLKERLLGVRWLVFGDYFLVASRTQPSGMMLSSLEDVARYCELLTDEVGLWQAIKARVRTSERDWLIARMQLMLNPPRSLTSYEYAEAQDAPQVRDEDFPCRFKEPMSPIEAYRRARWELTQLAFPYSHYLSQECFDQRRRHHLHPLSGTPESTPEQVRDAVVRFGLDAISVVLFPQLDLRQANYRYSSSASSHPEDQKEQWRQLQGLYEQAKQIVRQTHPDLDLYEAVELLRRSTAQQRQQLALDALPGAIEAMREAFADDSEQARPQRALARYTVFGLISDLDEHEARADFEQQSHQIDEESSARRRALRQASKPVLPTLDDLYPSPATPLAKEQEEAGEKVAQALAGLQAMARNPNKAVIAGHGLRENRDEDGTFRCKCGAVMGQPGFSREAARSNMRVHRQQLAEQT